MRKFFLPTELKLKYMLIKTKLNKLLKRKLLFLTRSIVFFICLFETGIASELKREVVKFSSETANIKKKDGVLHLSGDVTISYGQYLIKSDFLFAKTNGVGSRKIKIIEADKNIYFSNNKDIVAKGERLFMDVEKKFVSIEGNVEFSQGDSIIRAEKINVDLETETVDFEGIKESFIKN